MGGRGPVRLIRATDRVIADAGQSPGMIREEAMSSEGVWAGFVKSSPGMASGWHHHGEHDTFVYVLRGALRIEYGAGGREHAEGGPGDFLHIPARAVHREASGRPEGAESVVFRVGSGELLFNLEGPED
jgi:uncharacterized RmlC-like cupin family protein